jgi:agmatine deiminase
MLALRAIITTTTTTTTGAAGCGRAARRFCNQPTAAAGRQLRWNLRLPRGDRGRGGAGGGELTRRRLGHAAAVDRDEADADAQQQAGVGEWRMPAEWEPHARTWMAWPSSGYLLGTETTAADEARACWASVANAIVPFEPVSVVVDPGSVAVARSWLADAVEIVEAPLNDAWMRDIGPTFVQRRDDGAVAGVDWVFNGWGAQSWATWDKDAEIARRACAQLGVPIVASPMINEGGGIHVNGAGAALVTRTVQLGDGRNASWSQRQVEDELRRTIGVSEFVWLERGLTRDYEEFGTRGHVDMVACFADRDTVLVHDQQNPSHPDHAVSRGIIEQLQAVQGLRVVAVPAPEALHDEDGGFVDYSYINHYVCNGAVILCAFDDPGDERAAAILREAYPGRKVVLVDARPLFARGGGIHCITQQQPLPGVGAGAAGQQQP